ncbi:MAG: transporter [Myxococcota bacterium]
MRKFAAVLVLSLLLPTVVHAQTISTDRPGATDSATTVPQGALQLETGFEARREGSVQAVYHLLTVARIGLNDNFELRLTPPGTLTLNGAVRGTDPEVGLKVSSPLGESTDFGFLATASLPAVNPGTGSVLQARATASTAIGSATLAGTLGGSYGRVTAEGNQADFEGLAAVSFAFGLVGDLGAYVEGYATLPQNGEISPVADAGLTYLAAPWLQIDAYAGAGLYGDAPDWLAGAGLSVLVPPSVLDGASGE